MMLIGVALRRTGVVTGERSTEFYRRMTRLGFGIGIPLAAAGLAHVAVNDFSPDVALVGTIPNTIAMALTNYLTQTIVGLLVLDIAFGSTEPTLAVVAGIWALQLWWSTAWLERFRYGPAEWAWRCATYRRVTPLRR